jgi:hypothetical protein
LASIVVALAEEALLVLVRPPERVGLDDVIVTVAVSLQGAARTIPSAVLCVEAADTA